MIRKFSKYIYRLLLKPFFFLCDPELVHTILVQVGKLIGNCKPLRYGLRRVWKYEDSSLSQIIWGSTFTNPIGLSAGFDYNAQLTQILPDVGFGYMTVGTITHLSYVGNMPPRLGRLPQSRALMVNKGFKNNGIQAITRSLMGQSFRIPTGISIGRTNHPELCTQSLSISDIVAAFKWVQQSTVPWSYYELNISCPNLCGDVSFYPPANLRALLRAVTSLQLTKPLLIKMPIEKKDAEVLAMLEVISSFPIQGVIFGNLQKNRKHHTLVPKEIAKFPRGNFSGLPTQQRSTELIRLTRKTYGDRFVIIGCGGVFNAQDAYKKIRAGASLVQMITGMIYEGPQVIGEINNELATYLQRDGYTHISQAIGADIV